MRLAGARGRRPAGGPVHHRHPRRHRRDPARAGRVDLRDPRAVRAGSTATCRRSSSRTSGPSPTPRCGRPTTSALDEYLAAIAVARLVLGPRMRVQAPPNLVDLDECRAAARCRRRRLGRRLAAHPRPREPRAALALPRPAPRARRRQPASSCASGSPPTPSTSGPASPGSTPASAATSPPSPTETGWPAPAYARTGLPWQEPDGGFQHRQGTGRTDLHTTIDTDGRTTDRRGDFDDVYGDWDLLREQAARRRPAARPARRAGAAVDGTGPRGAKRSGWMAAPGASGAWDPTRQPH